ncbi:MAG: hypothetical protein R2941_24010 [Desulfobacterales bacterium]
MLAAESVDSRWRTGPEPATNSISVSGGKLTGNGGRDSRGYSFAGTGTSFRPDPMTLTLLGPVYDLFEDLLVGRE